MLYACCGIPNSVESWGVSHPVAIATISLVLGFLLSLRIYLPKRIIALIFPELIDAMIARSREIVIVQSEINVYKFFYFGDSYQDATEIEKIDMPFNVGATPSGDAEAAQLIMSYIAGAYGARKRISRYQQATPLPTHGLEIFVGGADANAAADWRWHRYRGDDHNYRFGDLILGRGVWSLRGKPYVAEVTEKRGRQEVIRDFGIAMFFPQLVETGRPAVFICGVWPFGTLAAAEVLVGKIKISKYEKAKIKKFMRKNIACYVMVECRVQPGSTFSAHVLSVDTFEFSETNVTMNDKV